MSQIMCETKHLSQEKQPRAIQMSFPSLIQQMKCLVSTVHQYILILLMYVCILVSPSHRVQNNSNAGCKRQKTTLKMTLQCSSFPRLLPRAKLPTEVHFSETNRLVIKLVNKT